MLIKIRNAKAEDCEAIHSLIIELAQFEKAEHEVITSASELRRDGFEIAEPLYKCFVAELNGEIVGMALCYFRYSTWKGKILYLEDLYVKAKNRSASVGKKLLLQAAEYALETECTRLAWEVLEWNEPAIAFYKKIGAELDAEWINCRLKTQADLKNFIKEFK